MKKLCNTAPLVFASTAAASAHADIPGTAAQPSTYQVTISRVELCRDSSCNNAFLIGSGTRSFDIAGTTAGAVGVMPWWTGSRAGGVS